MRIGIYDPYLDDLGGGEKYMMSIAQVLSKKNTVEVFWDNKSDLDTLLQRFHLDLSNVQLTKNIFSPRMNFLQRVLATKKYDLLIVLSDGSIPFVLSRKLYLHVQQPLNTTQVNSFWGKIKLSRVNGIFYNSEFTHHFVKNSFAIPSKVIYPPVAIHPRKVKKENIILHVGRFRVKNVAIDDYKKQNIMVNTFKKMIDKGLMNWKLCMSVSVMDKDQEDFSVLKKSAQGYPIEFFINKSNKDLWSLYSKAKIYWHASGYGEDLEKHPEYAEHFGISTVEAMGAGCVPIVINAGGQKEIVEDNKNGLLWDSLEDFQRKTNAVVGNQKMWERLSENAKVRANDFSFEKFAEQIQNFIQ